MDREKIDPRALSKRTFNPNSPAYNHSPRRQIISDIKPVAHTKPVHLQQPVTNKPEEPLHKIIQEKGLDEFFAQLEPHKLENTTEINTPKEKKKTIWPYTFILLSDFALLAYSFFNKARYHHIYIIVLIVNCLLAVGIFAKGKLNRRLILLYQLPLILITIAMVALFAYNQINTNKIYKKNYIEIKDDSANLTFQQKQNLATYQGTTIFNKDSYESESKVFYSLSGLQVAQSLTAGIVLLKRR